MVEHSGDGDRNCGAARDVVCVAASAGGLQALTELLTALPPGFPAAVAVVQHLHPHAPSMLAPILARKSGLEVVQATDGQALCRGCVYVAPPDQHLLVNPDGTVSLTRTQLVHFVRPSADLLLESAAASFRTRATAVILTGTGVDGQMGVQAIHKMGGTVIAQDEASSEFFGMPAAAIATGCVDRVLPLRAIAAALIEVVTTGDNR